MADQYVKIAGKATKLDSGQQEDLSKGLGSAAGDTISKPEAIRLAQKEHDVSLAEKEGGNLGAAVMKAGSGFGLLTPVDLKLTELIQGPEAAQYKRHVYAGAEALPGATVGDAIGMLGSGGLLPGAALEGAIGKAFGEAAGVVGGAAKLGLQGAVDGGIIGFGQAAEEAAIQNKDLTSEAILARTGAGVLYGGGIGTVLGGLGGGIKGVLSKGAGTLASSVGKEATEAAVLREMGASQRVMQELAAREGGMGGFLSTVDDQLAKEGVKLTSNPKQLSMVASRLAETASKEAVTVAKEFDAAIAGQAKGGPFGGTMMAPSWTEFSARVENSVAEKAMAPGGLDVAKRVASWLDSQAPGNALGSFEQWVKGRSQINFNALGDMATDVRKLYDGYLTEQMEMASQAYPTLEGSAGRVQSSLATKQAMETVLDIAEAKMAQPRTPMVTSNDMATAAMIGVAGSPMGAAGYMVSKVGMRAVAERFGPALTEAMWKASTGQAASSAVGQLKSAIQESLTKFFKSSELAGVKVATGKRDFSRKAFDADLERAYATVQKSREERFQRNVQEVKSLSLGDAITRKQDKAYQYLMPIMPQANYTQVVGKLRAIPKPVGLTAAEHMFKRQLGVAQNPLAVLADMQEGGLSKESVKAMKGMWPETYRIMVEQAKEHVLAAQQSGKTLSMGKITQLSILLDSPLDSTLTPGFIQPVQAALNTPPTPVQAPQPQSPTETGADLTTPAQEMI
jgi:hypothetical protein